MTCSQSLAFQRAHPYVSLARFLLFFCGFSGPDSSVGLVNLRALSLLPLLSPLLCSFLTWLLLFITSGVALGSCF